MATSVWAERRDATATICMHCNGASCDTGCCILAASPAQGRSLISAGYACSALSWRLNLGWDHPDQSFMVTRLPKQRSPRVGIFGVEIKTEQLVPTAHARERPHRLTRWPNTVKFRRGITAIATTARCAGQLPLRNQPRHQQQGDASRHHQPCTAGSMVSAALAGLCQPPVSATLRAQMARSHQRGAVGVGTVAKWRAEGGSLPVALLVVLDQAPPCRCPPPTAAVAHRGGLERFAPCGNEQPN